MWLRGPPGAVGSALHQSGALLQAPGGAPGEAGGSEATLWAEEQPEAGALGPAGHGEGKERAGGREQALGQSVTALSVLLQLLDNAVHTLELFLQPAAKLQPVCVPVKMAKARERVLKVKLWPPGSRGVS